MLLSIARSLGSDEPCTLILMKFGLMEISATLNSFSSGLTDRYWRITRKAEAKLA